jgi:ferritin-like protein
MGDDVSRRDAAKWSTTAGLGIAVALVLKGRSAQAQTSGSQDLGTLKALLVAERNAIKTYEAGKGVIDGAPMSDPLHAFKGVVTAIALHYRSQHLEHAAKLAKYLTDQGGVDNVGAGAAQIPTGFVGTIKNVIDLATNAEKAAAIAYTDAQKSIIGANNAELAAAIGANETQHFVVLNLVAQGLVVPPASTANQSETALASVVVAFSPKAFVTAIDGTKGLEDEVAVPFYDVTQ